MNAQSVTFINPNFNPLGSNLYITLSNFPCQFTTSSHQVVVELGIGTGTSFVSYWQTTTNTPITNTTSAGFNITLPINVRCNSTLKVTRLCGTTTTVVYASNPVFYPASITQITSPPFSQEICSASGGAIPINSIYPNSTYYWYAQSDNLNVTGESLSYQMNDSVTDVLINNSTSNQQIAYQIFIYNSSSCRTSTVTVKPSVPISPVLTVPSGNTSFCEGSSLQVNLTNQLNNQVYQPSGWFENGVSINSGTGLIVTESGSYTYVNNNGCGTSTSNTVNAIKILKPTLTSPTNIEICSGNNTNYTITSNEPCTYTWTANNANVSGETANSTSASINDVLVNNTFINQIVNYNLTLTSNASGCTKQIGVPFLVKPLPIVNSIQNTTICSDGILSEVLSSPVQTAAFNWSAQDNANISGETTTTSNLSTINEVLTNNGSSMENVIYTVNATSECGVGPSITFIISVRPQTNIIVTPSGPLEFCDGGSVNLDAYASGLSNYLWSNNSSGSNLNIYNTSNISVTGYDTYNCLAKSDTLHIFEHPIPAPIINYSNGVLSSNYPTGNQWNYNNQPILSANQDTYTPNTNGNYSLTVTIDGCSGNSSTVYFGSASLSENNPNPFTIHPNPATNQVIISSQYFTENEAIQIFNTAGQLVHEYPNLSPHHQTYTINVEQLNPGIYFIQIGEMTQKLIIE